MREGNGKRVRHDGVWLLKFAILAATAALFATFLEQVAASIVLYVAALTAIGVFVRKYARPAWRKYGKPLARLSEHMEKMETSNLEQAAELVEIREQLDSVEAKVDSVERKAVSIERGAGIAAERAASAISIAEAVQRKLTREVEDDIH